MSDSTSMAGNSFGFPERASAASFSLFSASLAFSVFGLKGPGCLIVESLDDGSLADSAGKHLENATDELGLLCVDTQDGPSRAVQQRCCDDGIEGDRSSTLSRVSRTWRPSSCRSTKLGSGPPSIQSFMAATFLLSFSMAASVSVEAP